MRAAAIALRAGLDPAWGEALTELVLARHPPVPGEIWAGYWPIGTEIDIRPLLHRLAANGPVLLPVTPPRGQPLIFRRWEPGDVLQSERFGTSAPAGELMVPDVILVPLLAFDARGGRLGYGAGYYDRTLAALPGRRTIGCAFAAQQVTRVPMDENDVRMDAIATEREVLFFRE